MRGTEEGLIIKGWLASEKEKGQMLVPEAAGGEGIAFAAMGG